MRAYYLGKGQLASLALLCGLSVALLGCGEECRDADEDGHGEGCGPGPDCDDGNPALTDNCEGLTADCREDAFGEGCPCLAGASRDCYFGPDDTADVGICSKGRQSCFTGTWSGCDAQVTPRFEQCNQADDDCDGVVDEGAQSPCGGCDPDCTGGVWGTSASPFVAEDELEVTSIGELTLARTPVSSDTVWVPNGGDRTLSKVDAVTARELARYALTGASPERVAVDFEGAAFVLAGERDGPSYLTKVAGDADRCLAGAPTSSGPDDVLANGEDGCVLLSLPLGDDGAFARSVSVDGTRAPDEDLGGHVWVGLAGEGALLQLDGRTGEERQRLETPDFRAHASVVDPWGALWIIDRDGIVARVNPALSPPEIERIEVPFPCYALESIASDAEGVLTLSGFACENVMRYDPRLDHWEQLQTEGVLGTRGVTAQVPVGASPRPLGDLTGSLRFGEFAPEGRVSHVFDGCSRATLEPDEQELNLPTKWERVHLIWAAGVDSSVRVEARHGQDDDSRRDAEWSLLGTLPKDAPPFELDFEDGGLVEVRLTLTADARLGAPRIGQVGVQWTCPGPD